MTDIAALIADPAVVAALGYDPDLSDRQTELLGVLLDPENDPTAGAEDVFEMLQSLGSFTHFYPDEAEVVGGRLREHYNHTTGSYAAFEFELIRTDYGVEQYNVLTAVGSAGTWLARSDDVKYLAPDRYGLTGLRAALKIAENIVDEYELLLAERDRLTTGAFSRALDRAADKIAQISPADERLRDALNLMVNAALHFTEHPDADLDDAIEAMYDQNFAAELIESLR